MRGQNKAGNNRMRRYVVKTKIRNGRMRGETKRNRKRKIGYEKLRLETEARIEIEKEKIQFELKMKELELQGKSKPKSLPLDSSQTFDVTKHIRLIPPFQEKKVNTFFTFGEGGRKPEMAKRALDLTFSERCNRHSSRNLHSAFTRTKLRL